MGAAFFPGMGGGMGAAFFPGMGGGIGAAFFPGMGGGMGGGFFPFAMYRVVDYSKILVQVSFSSNTTRIRRTR
jgi:hypothetical protein